MYKVTFIQVNYASLNYLFLKLALKTKGSRGADSFFYLYYLVENIGALTMTYKSRSPKLKLIY